MIKKGRSVSNPFGIELPYQLAAADLEYLVRHLRAGLASQDEINEIYMSHMRLAMRIASIYSWRAPHLIQDLVQAAMLAIAEALDSAPRKLVDNNITPYIVARIKGAISDEIAAQFVMPGRTYRHKLKQTGTQPVAPIYQQLKDDKPGPNPSTVDIVDALDHCINKGANLKVREYKRVILRLKAAGYTNAEIASIIEISETYVQSILADIKKSYAIINQE